MNFMRKLIDLRKFLFLKPDLLNLGFTCGMYVIIKFKISAQYLQNYAC